jgi:putative hemolysin
MELIIIFFLTFLNGFFALSEIALVSVKKSKIEHLAWRWNKQAKIVLELRENPEEFLSSVQVGITLIGIIAGAYGWSAVAGSIEHIIQVIPFIWMYSEPLSLMIAIGGITYFSIVIGELVPKSIAMNNPEKIALLCVPILVYFMKITHPFVRLLSYSTTLILKTLNIRGEIEEKISEEELIALLKTAKKQWVIDKEEGEIHNNIFSFSSQTARGILTHRNDVEWIDIHDTPNQVFKKIKNSVHSKFVVADGSLDTIVGILRLRDFLENQTRKNFDLHDIIMKPIIVTIHTPAIKILNTFKKRKEYIAIVKDEFWGTEGIVTLHDLIEVIIGDLPDEDEEMEANIMKRGKDEYLINGKTLIYEINQYFQEEIIQERKNDYTTLSGYMMDTFSRLPKTGEKMKWQNDYEFEIIDMDLLKIDKVLIRKINT